jgi:hypothetical protein
LGALLVYAAHAAFKRQRLTCVNQQAGWVTASSNRAGLWAGLALFQARGFNRRAT